MLPYVGLNMVTDAPFAAAIKPLVAEGLVEALEWDVDSPWIAKSQSADIPFWVDRLLDLYASKGRLYGHCVWLSTLAPHRLERQTGWLKRLKAESSRRSYVLMSEHLGFMNAGPYLVNTLLPVPYVSAAVRVGRDCLGRFAEATGTHVGLENLAGALTPSDAIDQAAFLDDIVSPSESFILVDVHNIFAQSVNLGLDPFWLLATYPASGVRVIHLSGGRWRNVAGQPYRFDGHNGAVPDEVHSLLRTALVQCPNVEVVIFERRGNSLETEADAINLQNDYRHLAETVRTFRAERIGRQDLTTVTKAWLVKPNKALSSQQQMLARVALIGRTSSGNLCAEFQSNAILMMHF